MTNTNKARGSQFESDVVAYLREHGQPKAARTLAGSSLDRGDIQGVENWALQLKRVRRYQLGPWSDEARQQAIHGHNDNYAVITKRWGVGPIDESFVILPLRTFAALLRKPE